MYQLHLCISFSENVYICFYLTLHFQLCVLCSSLPVLFLSVYPSVDRKLFIFLFFRSIYKLSSDINECTTNPCGENAECKDTVGSFSCLCKEGFTGDPLKKCHDIDECSALEKPCGSHAICQNAEPGYNCICPQGYEANPNPEVACEQVTALFIF